MCTRAVVYYRVSTDKQGVSGLGLEAQRNAAETYCKKAELTIVAEYEEVISGTKNNREKLLEALRRVEVSGDCKLVVAKLDRISRDVGFIDRLQKSGVQFVCADMPEANQTMLTFMSVFAQYEARMASERTTAALAVKKAQGVKLGNPNLKEARAKVDVVAASRKGNDIRTKKANEYAEKMEGFIEQARDNGASTLQQIATYLNDRGITTAGKKAYTATAVKRMLDRL
jgi:DNA invertase Pin-like site-specific DNA recombinase